MVEIIHNLHLPESYRNATDQERSLICNGAGAKDGIKFPNTFYGLDMREAFDIHDWDYHHGKTREDKARADKYMLLNLMVIIESTTGLKDRLLKPLRRRRALKYYEAVVTFGDKAFWYGKDIR
jgi:hypothetical protein